MTQNNASARIGVDIGGTFTDVALEVGSDRFTAKVLTSADNPAIACMTGIDDVLAAADLSPKDVSVIIHGTTLATNAIIERKGATTSLLTTEGFRDTIEIGTEGRPEQYDINIIQPEPLVPRRRRFTVEERLNSRGEELVPLLTENLDDLLPALDAAGTESLAIAFVHSYANPDHERRARDHIAAKRPDWSITISAEISPEFREFERFSTACANAYVRPIIERYLTDFETKLSRRGFDCPLLLMLSSGGLTTVETAKAFPVRLVESGPAGGAIFACEIADTHGIDKVLSFDMGGTTAKICMIDGGRAQTNRRFEVARVYRFRKDSGIPLRIPVIEMVEIGAGGGSIASIDELGRIAVGPSSAGSSPGPACYDLGGTQATVTDANLIMGRIDAASFAGGSMPLAPAKAEAALDADVASPMSMPPLAAAYGITEMVCENMATAARVHAIESGKNVDDRTLVAFGGAAPLHACQLAEKLGIGRIVIPRNAGVGSAVGFLRAPISYEVIRTLYQCTDTFEPDVVNTVYAEMEDEATRHVRRGAGADAALTVRRQAYMRYQGQGHEIVVDIPNDPFDDGSADLLQSLLDRGYKKAFGRDIGAIASAEVVAWSVTVSTAAHDNLERERWAESVAASAAASANGGGDRREVFDTAAQSLIDYTIHDRGALAAETSVEGPAIIVEDETSTVVGSRFAATILPGGEIEMRRQDGSKGAG